MDIMMSKIGFFKAWGVSGDKVVIGKEDYEPSEIKTVSIQSEARGLTNGVIQITLKSGKFFTLGYKSGESEKAHQAIDWIIANSSDELAKAKAENLEIHCKCNICGKIWSFNMNDLEMNEELMKIASSSAKGAKLSAISALMGAPMLSAGMATYSNSATANMAVSQMKDYFRCPSCNSTKFDVLEDEDLVKLSTNGDSSVSAADEIKKFKELLDSGIITQEEFDAKKKQLLGL